jgi:photosystem II stability/assembly factor-like uncharacterized protein
MPNSRNIILLFVGLVVVILAVIFFTIHRARPASSSNQTILTPVESISYQFHNHIHGLGYDSQNRRLFIATHYGIFIWNDGKLFQLGDNRDDFMGFSLHPSNSNTIYTSGHPKNGGNMGVTKSEDGGVTFKPIFRGLSGEAVDFHSMTINVANSRILYGWFQGKLYRTKDGGKSWQSTLANGLPNQGLCFGAPCLNADSKDERILYAGSPNGLLISRDFGENWTMMNSQLGAVAGIGIDPLNSKRLFAFAEKLGLASSRDEGKNWQSRNKGLELSRREFVFAFAFDREKSNHLFAATPENIFRTRDGGERWEKIL